MCIYFLESYRIEFERCDEERERKRKKEGKREGERKKEEREGERGKKICSVFDLPNIYADLFLPATYVTEIHGSN